MYGCLHISYIKMRRKCAYLIHLLLVTGHKKLIRCDLRSYRMRSGFYRKKILDVYSLLPKIRSK